MVILLIFPTPGGYRIPTRDPNCFRVCPGESSSASTTTVVGSRERAWKVLEPFVKNYCNALKRDRA